MQKNEILKTFNRTKDKLIVAGNGPSLGNIDYTRMPEDYDVFRCNQFYFEDKYFLGKKVKAFFATAAMFYYQYYTYKHLLRNGDYQIEHIISSNASFVLEPLLGKCFHELFPLAICGVDIIRQHKIIKDFVMEQWIYNDKFITSGFYACAIGAILGYKEIYIAGIDFYEDNKTYVFDNSVKKNLYTIIPEFDNSDIANWHSKECDISLLRLLISLGVKFYSLVPNSAISNIVSLAPQTQSTLDSNILKTKPSETIKDICIPASKVFPHYYKTLLQKIDQNALNHLEKTDEIPRYIALHPRNNFYIKLMSDLLSLPRHVKTYIKRKLSTPPPPPQEKIWL
ncbi:alpha-2,3-sialyltransferase [Helicobacter sp.]|uniref:alpha-2,3-sialyltransferase n=1 Tax=Helicobacter sp. TaxID=218 RepID=UPI0025C34410|nr:alpha-2,3-sialyltransferase [Helicobacter sp.]MCI5633051.1 alpha-2,3 sialyltransferase [Helicobacter sp.]